MVAITPKTKISTTKTANGDLECTSSSSNTMTYQTSYDNDCDTTTHSLSTAPPLSPNTALFFSGCMEGGPFEALRRFMMQGCCHHDHCCVFTAIADCDTTSLVNYEYDEDDEHFCGNKIKNLEKENSNNQYKNNLQMMQSQTNEQWMLQQRLREHHKIAFEAMSRKSSRTSKSSSSSTSYVQTCEEKQPTTTSVAAAKANEETTLLLPEPAPHFLAAALQGFCNPQHQQLKQQQQKQQQPAVTPHSTTTVFRETVAYQKDSICNNKYLHGETLRQQQQLPPTPDAMTANTSMSTSEGDDDDDDKVGDCALFIIHAAVGSFDDGEESVVSSLVDPDDRFERIGQNDTDEDDDDDDEEDYTSATGAVGVPQEGQQQHQPQASSTMSSITTNFMDGSSSLNGMMIVYPSPQQQQQQQQQQKSVETSSISIARFFNSASAERGLFLILILYFAFLLLEQLHEETSESALIQCSCNAPWNSHHFHSHMMEIDLDPLTSPTTTTTIAPCHSDDGMLA